MLMPKRTKYRKSHRWSYDGKAKGNVKLNLGDYGLVAEEGAWISAKQIEAARIAMTRFMKRGGNVYINIFPHMPRTKKPLEVKKGKIMFEVSGVTEDIAREALRLASHKVSVKTRFVMKEKDGDSLGN